MARGAALKRVTPASLESDGGEGAAKKLKASVDVASKAAAAVRSGPLEAEDSESDSIDVGEDAQTATSTTINGVTYDQDHGEQGGASSAALRLYFHAITSVVGPRVADLLIFYLTVS